MITSHRFLAFENVFTVPIYPHEIHPHITGDERYQIKQQHGLCNIRNSPSLGTKTSFGKEFLKNFSSE